MSNYTLELKDLKRSISKGNIGQVIDELIHFTEGRQSSMTTEIYLIAARFRLLEAEKMRGEISGKDHKLEFNAITLSVLEIIDSLEVSGIGAYQDVQPKEQIRRELAELSKQYAATQQIRSVQSEYRSKIHIARKMAEKLIPWPDLIKEYTGTTDEAMICAIGRKVKIIADVDDLLVLESIVQHAKSNLTKNFIVNALAELIYSSQLRIGDDVIVRDILETLLSSGDIVLKENVERTMAALDFLSGKLN